MPLCKSWLERASGPENKSPFLNFVLYIASSFHLYEKQREIILDRNLGGTCRPNPQSFNFMPSFQAWETVNPIQGNNGEFGALSLSVSHTHTHTHAVIHALAPSSNSLNSSPPFFFFFLSLIQFRYSLLRPLRAVHDPLLSSFHVFSSRPCYRMTTDDASFYRVVNRGRRIFFPLFLSLPFSRGIVGHQFPEVPRGRC